MRIREAKAAHAGAIARVHVDSWRTTYPGIVPDEYLAALDVTERESRWRAIFGRCFRVKEGDMRSTPMSFDFADSSNRRIYAHWHVPLLERLFGDTLDFHWDLYEITHLHRREHNCGEDGGPCTAWPSPPYRAPVWQIIAERIGAKRFLEVGTGLGYTAALMADAGGPDSHVDTIEIDPVHADLAEAELSKRGLSDRVRILRGDAMEILQTLDEPYDAVFSDGGQNDTTHELRWLTRPGGAGGGIKSRLREPLIGALTGLRASLANKTEPELEALSRARAAYRKTVCEVLC